MCQLVRIAVLALFVSTANAQQGDYDPSHSLRTSPKLIPEEGSPPVLTSSNPLSTLHRRFACARLSQPCLPESCPGVSATLNTIAFDNSSSRWLESTPDCRPRRALLHLPYSCASPFGPAILVTHDPKRSSMPLAKLRMTVLVP